jgi:rubrerythrin
MSVGYLKKCSSNGKPKKRYDTQAEAEKQRSGLIRMGVWKVGNSNTYFCNQCGGYHAGKLGRSNRGGGRKIAKNPPRFLASQ